MNQRGREAAVTGAKAIWNWLAGRARQWRSRSPRHLRLCETLALGERRFVAVVQFEEQKFLIGGTGTSVGLLARLSSGPKIPELPNAGQDNNERTGAEAVQ